MSIQRNASDTVVNGSTPIMAETIVAASAAGPDGSVTSDLQATQIAGSAVVSPAVTVPGRRGAASPAVAERGARYQPVRQIGEGGMGEVVLSRDQTIGREVAVKRLKQLADSGTAATEFLEEVRTTGRLEHPGIVPIYDAGWDADGTPYFVMKYVEGEPLDSIIAKLAAGDATYQHRFSFEHRTQIFMQLLNAVQYAHRRGVLHLDIKPANVLVGPFGEVVLVDWGIARAHAHAQAQAKAQAGTSAASEQPAPQKTSTPEPPASRDRASRRNAPVTITGTPDYMAPEQAMGKVEDIGPHTDTYCLCVLFYELITLHHYLLPRETLEGRLTSILVEEPLSGIQMHHRYGAPPELANYTRYGLGKEITDRYLTVDEMVEKLQAVMDGDIPIACPCTGVKRAANGYGTFMNEHPNLALMGIGLLALFALFGVVDLVRLVATHSS